jgi:hypothetical protein
MPKKKGRYSLCFCFCFAWFLITFLGVSQQGQFKNITQKSVFHRDFFFSFFLSPRLAVASISGIGLADLLVAQPPSTIAAAS